MPDLAPSPAVVIVGGGIAAMEAVLALRDLSDGRIRPTVIAPNAHFSLRPLDVVRPFAAGHSEPLALGPFLAEHRGRFVQDAAVRVDVDDQVVLTRSGQEVPYDVLLLAPGARAEAPFDGVMTFGVGAGPNDFAELLSDFEQGYSRSAAFVVPPGTTWPLPLYELALMTARDVAGMQQDVRLHLITPEEEPLELFGTDAAAAVRDLLDAAGVTLHTGHEARVPRHGHVQLTGDERVVVDRIVALPRLSGPDLTDVPSDAAGFIPTDDRQRVRGLDRVYAVGDATTSPIKQGGLACQQADVAAIDIVERTGARVVLPRPEPVLRGRLLTGSRDRYLRRSAAEDTGRHDEEPLWWPPAKVYSRYLAPWLAARDLVHLPDARAVARGIDIAIPVPHAQEAHR